MRGKPAMVRVSQSKADPCGMLPSRHFLALPQSSMQPTYQPALLN